MTEPCICGHDEDEHTSGAAGCLAVTDSSRDLFCPCPIYDPGPPF